jgi:hypothetical protein
LRFYDTRTIERVDVPEDEVSVALQKGLVPSVSTVLGLFYPEHILNWNIRNSIKHYIANGNVEDAVYFRNTESADFGTVCHSLLEYYLGEGIPDGIYYDLDYKRHLSAVRPLFDWIDKNVEEVIFTESSFADPELKYGGTADLMVLLKDKRYMLLDLKCKKHRSAYPMKPNLGYVCQLSAYRQHFKKEFGEMEIGNLLIAAPIGNGLKTPRLRFWDYTGLDWMHGFDVAYRLWLHEFTDELPDFVCEIS